MTQARWPELYLECHQRFACGNMLTLTTAVCLREGSADYAASQWGQLTQWTDYLVEHGLDPEPQLVTDDFTG